MTTLPLRRFAAACLLATAAAAQGSPFDTTGPFVQYGVSASQGRITEHTNQWVRIDSPSYLLSQTGTVHLEGQGDTGVGRALVQGSGAGYDAYVFAGWHDRFVINPSDPGLNGQTVLMTFDLGYDWSAQVSGSPVGPSANEPYFGQAFIDVNLLRTGFPSRYATVGEYISGSCTRPGTCGSAFAYTGGSNPQPTFANGVASFSFSVVLGATYDLVLGMNASVKAYGGSVLVDAAHSMTWGGIRSITLIDNGQPLPVPSTVSSLSGLNFLAPVPEPSTWMLWATGVWVIGRWRARRGLSPAGRA